MSSAQPPERSTIDVPDVSSGLVLNLPPHKVPPGALVSDSDELRIRNGQLTNEMIGFIPFPDHCYTESPVKLLANHVTSTGSRTLIIGDYNFVYRYDAGTERTEFISTAYNTGTLNYPSDSALLTSNGGTTWLADVKAGDRVFVGSSSERTLVDVAGTVQWAVVDSVLDNTNLFIDGPILGWTHSATEPYIIVRSLGGAIGDNWSSDMFLQASPGLGDVWYGTLGREFSKGTGGSSSDLGGFIRWDGSATEFTYVNLGFLARKMRQHKRMMVYLDITEAGQRRPQSMRNSDLEAPEVADGNTGLSREIRASNSTDMSKNLRALGDNLIAYFDDSVNVLQFVGEPFVWVIRTALPKFGLLADNLVQDRGNNIHEFISQDRAYEFNGVETREFGPQVFREVLRGVDRSRLDMAVSYTDTQYGETFWNIPLRADLNNAPGDPARAAYVSHYREQRADAPAPVTKRFLPATAYVENELGGTARWTDFSGQTFASVTRPWGDTFFATDGPVSLVGVQDPAVGVNGTVVLLSSASYYHYFSNSTTTYPLQSRAVFGRAPVFDGDMAGVVRRIYPYFRVRYGATYTVTVELRYYRNRDDAEANAVFKESLQFSVGGSEETEWKRPTPYGARWVDVVVSHIGENEPWTLDGISAQTSKAGMRV